MQVHTAVIPVAGIGTRAFPLTTAIEKSMLPVYAGDSSRPLVDFMVEDCAKAGIQRIIFVTSERGRTQLSDYFGDLNISIMQQLTSLGKTDKIRSEHERRTNYHLEYEYLIQKPGKYGTAIPLYLARDALKGEEHFIMMGGDDFVYHPDGASELELAIKTWALGGTDHTIMGAPVSRTSAVKYGVLQINDNGRLISIDEKPPLAHVPKHPVVNITRHLLSNAIWGPLDKEVKTDRGSSEHYITYAITDALERGQTFQVHEVKGQYLDGGSYEGLTTAGEYIRAHPPIKVS